eukprot:2846-Pelagomonas_calceolata.AAC.3
MECTQGLVDDNSTRIINCSWCCSSARIRKHHRQNPPSKIPNKPICCPRWSFLNYMEAGRR